MIITSSSINVHVYTLFILFTYMCIVIINTHIILVMVKWPERATTGEMVIPHGAYIVSMCHNNYAVAHACAEEIPSNNYLFMVGAANGEVDPKVALNEVESKGMYAVVCKYMIAFTFMP